MILTKPVILREIRKRRIRIEPFCLDAVGPASIDLTLDSKIRVFGPARALQGEVDYRRITKVVDIRRGFVLKPGKLVLGITKEKISLPNNIAGWLNSRSRFARIGLMSHITAPFISPGVENRQVLEIYNAGKCRIRLLPGMRICQIVLQYCKGSAKYSGIYKSQVF